MGLARHVVTLPFIAVQGGTILIRVVVGALRNSKKGGGMKKVGGSEGGTPTPMNARQQSRMLRDIQRKAEAEVGVRLKSDKAKEHFKQELNREVHDPKGSKASMT